MGPVGVAEAVEVALVLVDVVRGETVEVEADDVVDDLVAEDVVAEDVVADEVADDEVTDDVDCAVEDEELDVVSVGFELVEDVETVWTEEVVYAVEDNDMALLVEVAEADVEPVNALTLDVLLSVFERLLGAAAVDESEEVETNELDVDVVLVLARVVVVGDEVLVPPKAELLKSDDVEDAAVLVGTPRL